MDQKQVVQAYQCLLTIQDNARHFDKLIKELESQDDIDAMRKSHFEQDRVLENTFQNFSAEVQAAARARLHSNVQIMKGVEDGN